MNVILPIDKEMNFYRKVIYIFVLIVCIIAISMAVYFQYYKNGNIVNTNENVPEEVDTKQMTKDEFDNIFNNELITDMQYDKPKDYEKYDLVFTRYKANKTEENKYSLDLNIPYINIKDEKIAEFNNKISNIFVEKAKSIMNSENNSNVVYTIQYTSCIKNNILSLAIKVNLKEGNNPQRVIIQTYNYDLANKKEITVSEALAFKGITIKNAENEIKEEIQKVQSQVAEFEKLGYTIYTRNPEDDMYKIENTHSFYIDNNDNLYLIYSYGNKNLTSEIDLVVF